MSSVHVDEQGVLDALSYSDKILGLSKIQNTPNYTGLENPGRFFIGELGEIAFATWLDSNHPEISYKRLRNDAGHSDDGDFLIGSNHIDVKNTAHPRARYLMMPKAQFSLHHRQIYVAARTTIADGGANVEMCGWIDRQHFEDYAEVINLKVETMRLLLDKLIPMEDLF